MSSLPLVSCILPTFGRCPKFQHLVEEAVESFLRQTYPAKELILLNDSPDQILVCEAPGVRVVNVPCRYPSLGEKRNAGVRMSNGELIAMWDDDDISLPWRLSHSVEKLESGDYFNSHFYWYMDQKHIYPDVKIHPAGSLSMFRRSAFEEVGGYPLHSFGEDKVLEEKLRFHVAPAGYRMPLRSQAVPSEVYYIYRWGVSPVHLSGKNEHGMYEAIGKRPVAAGTFEIIPHWRMDYGTAAQSFNSRPRSSTDVENKPESHQPVLVETDRFLSVVDAPRSHVAADTQSVFDNDDESGICVYV